MRWRKPAEGAKKKVSRFLLSPMTIGKETRWLEWATWEEVYSECNRWIIGDEYTNTGGKWLPRRWVDKKEEDKK